MTLAEICDTCGREMRLVGTERPEDRPRIVLTYECECGEIVAVEETVN
jgi:hypothetical protein